MSVFKSGSTRHIALIKKQCKKCGKIRKFLKGTQRDIEDLCGNCWDWDNDPQIVLLTSNQKKRLDELLNKQ